MPVTCNNDDYRVSYLQRAHGVALVILIAEELLSAPATHIAMFNSGFDTGCPYLSQAYTAWAGTLIF
jgi:hypothetical protein